MAFSDLGSIGATGSTSNNQSTLALTTSAVCNVGDLVVLVIADDNQGSGADGTGNEVSGVADNAAGGTNNWQKAADFANNNGASQAGAAVSIWYTVVARQIANGGTITATFASSTLSDATAMTGRRFSFTGTLSPVILTATLANDAADPGSLDVTTPNLEHLRIRGIAAEVGNNTNLTASGGGWTAWANGNSATTGTTSEMCARAEHLISTGTGAASDPTYVAADCASAYVAFRVATVTQKSLTPSHGQSVTTSRLYGKPLLAQPAISQNVSGLARAQIRSSLTGTSLGQAVSGTVDAYLAVAALTGTYLQQIITETANFVSGGGGPATTQKAITLAQAQSITLVRAIRHIITLAQAEAITLLRRTGRIVTLAQSQSVTKTLLPGHVVLVSSSLTQSVSAKRLINHVVSVSQGMVATVTRAIAKLVSLAQAQSVSGTVDAFLLLSGETGVALGQAVTVSGALSHPGSSTAKTVSLAQTNNASGVARAQIRSSDTGTSISQIVSTFRSTAASTQKAITVAIQQSVSGTVDAFLLVAGATGTAISQTVSTVRNLGAVTTQKVISAVTSSTLYVTIEAHIRRAIGPLATSQNVSGTARARLLRTSQTGSGLSEIITLTKSFPSRVSKLINVATSSTIYLTIEAHIRHTMGKPLIGQTITVFRRIAHRVTMVLAQAITILRVKARLTSVVLTQAQVVRVIRGLRKLLVTTITSVVIARISTGKRFTVTTAETVQAIVTRVRVKSVGIVQSQLVTLLRGVRKITVVTMAQIIVQGRNLGYQVTVVQSQLVTLSRTVDRVATTFLKSINVVQGQVVTVRRAMSTTVVTTITEMITLGRSTSKTVLVSMAQTVNAFKGRSRAIVASTVQVVTAVASKAAGSTANLAINVTQSQLVLLRRTSNVVVRLSQGSLITLRRSAAHVVSLTTAQSINLVRRIGRLITAATPQVISLVAAHRVTKLIVVAQSNLVTLVTQAFRQVHSFSIVISAPLVMGVSVIKRVGISILVGALTLTTSVVASGVRNLAAVISVTMEQATTLRLGVGKIIRIVTTQTVTVARRFVDVIRRVVYVLGEVRRVTVAAMNRVVFATRDTRSVDPSSGDRVVRVPPED